MGDFLNKRLEQYLENFSSEMDKQKKEELMTSLTYFSNLSKNIPPTDKNSTDTKNSRLPNNRIKPKNKKSNELSHGFDHRNGNFSFF